MKSRKAAIQGHLQPTGSHVRDYCSSESAHTKYVADAGYDTAEKFTEWVMQSAISSATAAPPVRGRAGARGEPPPGRFSGGDPVFTVVVTGGSNNNYWCMGGMRPQRTLPIDNWR